MGKILANVKSNTFHIKLLWLLFGQRLGKNWATFNLAFGHAAVKAYLAVLPRKVISVSC